MNGPFAPLITTAASSLLLSPPWLKFLRVFLQAEPIKTSLFFDIQRTKLLLENGARYDLLPLPDLLQALTCNTLENSLGYLESSQAPAQHKKMQRLY